MNNKLKDIVLFLTIFLIVGFVFLSIEHNKEKNIIGLRVIEPVHIINVATSIFPIYDIVKNVGGNTVNVILLRDKKAFNLYKDKNHISFWFIAGEGVDNWAVNASKNNNVKYSALSNNVDIAKLAYDVKIGKLPQHSPNYYWLSFHGAQNIAVVVARDLSKIDPTYRERYIDNAFNYSRNLEQYQKDFENEYNNLKNKKVFASEHFFDNFLYYFNIKTIGLFNPNTEDNISELSYNIRYYGTRDIIIPEEYKFAGNLKTSLKKDNVHIIKLDITGSMKYSDYIDFMRYNFSIFLSKMRE